MACGLRARTIVDEDYGDTLHDLFLLAQQKKSSLVKASKRPKKLSMCVESMGAGDGNAIGSNDLALEDIVYASHVGGVEVASKDNVPTSPIDGGDILSEDSFL
ncbi:hypothetical protein GOP47_0000908 [Adiantum capillus-veneris]|uniref:Uncharacterized protein n=1 Tax=Adiantum capillus-veneris TaxID=13818 RepID=A0A9D4VES4_ADICA|nr:hypothetical protein GOP47_0000908 [Adiantum capillus-veneris]